jgi:hypothetical protein
MLLLRRIRRACSSERRFAGRAAQLRKAARDIPPDVEHDELIRKGPQTETAAHIGEWLRSKELRPPK